MLEAQRDLRRAARELVEAILAPLRLGRSVAVDIRRWGGTRLLAVACGVHAALTGTGGEVPGFLLRRVEPLVWPRVRRLGDLIGITPAPGESLTAFIDRLDWTLRP